MRCVLLSSYAKLTPAGCECMSRNLTCGLFCVCFSCFRQPVVVPTNARNGIMRSCRRKPVVAPAAFLAPTSM